MSKGERKVRGIRFGRDVASGFFLVLSTSSLAKKGKRNYVRGKKKTWAHLWKRFFGHRSQGENIFPNIALFQIK